MTADLIDALKRRVADPKRRTDDSEHVQFDPPPPLTPADLDRSVQMLGFRPPEPYLAVLSEVANGGFGPGYGMAGLIGGAPFDDGQNVVEAYLDMLRPVPTAPHWQWRERLLPLNDWGCAMSTCLDCSDDEMRLMHFDPNVLSEDQPYDIAFLPMSMRLPEWLALWAAGEDLWSIMQG